MDTNLSLLVTERRNPHTKQMDQMSTQEMLKVMNQEDQRIALAVQNVLADVEKGIEMIYDSLQKGGRLFYIGAGTSGRIGLMDAAECPPTFLTPPDQIKAILAGGDTAVHKAVENCEDSYEQGAYDLQDEGVQEEDVIVGITASGRTPYPIGALQYAQQLGASTIALSCNENAVISEHADVKIEVIVGPEVLTGSTRLKAATAHKMILNMFTTVTMVKLGKVYENLMVDVHASNFKLRERAKRMLMSVTNVSYEEAEETLTKADNKVKPAIVMLKANVSYTEAQTCLKQAGGFVRQAAAMAQGHHSPSTRKG